MERHIRRGLAVVLTTIGLAACADSLAPTKRRALPPSPTFNTSGDVTGSFICTTPCPPGMICAAVCDYTTPIEVAPPPATSDTTSADATVVVGPTRKTGTTW